MGEECHSIRRIKITHTINMKKIIEDLGGVFDSNDPINKQQSKAEDVQNTNFYTVYLQFDNDQPVALMHIPFGREFILRIKEPTDNSILNNEHVQFSDSTTNKSLKIFTKK